MNESGETQKIPQKKVESINTLIQPHEQLRQFNIQLQADLQSAIEEALENENSAAEAMLRHAKEKNATQWEHINLAYDGVTALFILIMMASFIVTKQVNLPAVLSLFLPAVAGELGKKMHLTRMKNAMLSALREYQTTKDQQLYDPSYLSSRLEETEKTIENSAEEALGDITSIEKPVTKNQS